MKSFIDLDKTFGGQPRQLGGVLAHIDVGRGREQLYRNQVPELLRSLANQTEVELDQRLQRHRRGGSRSRACA